MPCVDSNSRPSCPRETHLVKDRAGLYLVFRSIGHSRGTPPTSRDAASSQLTRVQAGRGLVADAIQPSKSQQRRPRLGVTCPLWLTVDSSTWK